VQVGQVTAVAWPAELPLALVLAEAADRTHEWPGLGARDPGPIRLVVVPDEARMREMSGGRAPSWGAGVALPGSRTIIIRADAREPEQTLRHELAHLALRRAIRSRTPLWFDEGYAAFASGEWDRLDRLALNLAVVRGALPELGELDGALRGRAPAAEASYALAMSAILELARRNPSGTLEPLIALLADGVPFEDAVQRTTGLNPGQFAVAWREGVRRRYGLITWLAAGGLWALVALAVLGAAWFRRRADRPRREALDDGWVVADDPPPEELDRMRESE
jgi:hypothetical protein